MSDFSFMGITKLGEGTLLSDEDVVIHMRWNEVLDWLSSRNVIGRGWATEAAACRKEAEAEGVDDYMGLVKHFEQAQAAGDCTRGIFGGFKDEQLARLEGEVERYRRGNVHLGELAQQLIQLLAHEVPSLKRGLDKSARQLAEWEALERALKEEEASQLRAHEKSCQEWGLDGTCHSGQEEVKRAIRREAMKRLPRHYEVMVERVMSVREALEFYEGFVQYTTGVVHLTALPRLMQQGNTLIMHDKKEKEEEKEEVEEEVVEINWNEEEEEEEDDDDAEWGIEVASSAVGETMVQHDDEDDDDETMLESAQWRALLTEELLQVHCFFEARLLEHSFLEAEGRSNLVVAAPDCPPVVRSGDERLKLMRFKTEAENALKALQDESYVQLEHIRSSPFFLARLAERVMRKLAQARRTAVRRSELTARRTRLVAQMAADKQRLVASEKRSRQLKELLATEIGTMFKRKCVIK